MQSCISKRKDKKMDNNIFSVALILVTKKELMLNVANNTVYGTSFIVHSKSARTDKQFELDITIARKAKTIQVNNNDEVVINSIHVIPVCNGLPGLPTFPVHETYHLQFTGVVSELVRQFEYPIKILAAKSIQTYESTAWFNNEKMYTTNGISLVETNSYFRVVTASGLHVDDIKKILKIGKLLANNEPVTLTVEGTGYNRVIRLETYRMIIEWCAKFTEPTYPNVKELIDRINHINTVSIPTKELRELLKNYTLTDNAVIKLECSDGTLLIDNNPTIYKSSRFDANCSVNIMISAMLPLLDKSHYTTLKLDTDRIILESDNSIAILMAVRK